MDLARPRRGFELKIGTGLSPGPDLQIYSVAVLIGCNRGVSGHGCYRSDVGQRQLFFNVLVRQ